MTGYFVAPLRSILGGSSSLALAVNPLSSGTSKS